MIGKQCGVWARIFIVMSALLLANPPDSHATSCGPGKVAVWPQSGSTVPTNGVFLVVGTGMQTGSARAVAAQRPRLTSPAGDIRLEVLKVYMSTAGYGSTAVSILKPVEPLQPGVKYSLELREIVVPGQTGLEGNRDRDDDSEPRRKPKPIIGNVKLRAWFKAGTEPDTLAPRWLDSPKLAATTFTQVIGQKVRGVNVELRASSAHKGEVFYEARLTDLDDPRNYQEFPVFSGASNQIYIGNNLCNRKFTIDSTRRYRLVLQPVDWARNRGRRSTPIEFGPEVFENARDPYARPSTRQ